MKALSYLRVSGKGQVDGDGFPRQRASIEAYARAQGVELVGEYVDAGVSGTRDLDDRAGLAALIDRIESNGVRLVLVERADRLARDLMIGEIILSKFRTIGVRVVAVEGNTDLTVDDSDPTRVLVRQVLGAIAQYDKAVTVLKLRAARDRKRRQQGRCEGRKPYGDTPAEQQAIERIKSLRRQRPGGKAMSYAAIANAMNETGIPTRYGKPWKPGTIYAILRGRK